MALVNRVVSTIDTMRENVHFLRGSSSVNLCSWLFYNLSSKCSGNTSSLQEGTLVLNELKTGDGYCISDWNRYTDHC